MVALLVALFFLAWMPALGSVVAGRWMGDFDPVERLGIAGLLGLGVAGWIAFVGALALGSHAAAPIVGLALGFAAAFLVAKKSLLSVYRVQMPRSLVSVGVGLLLLIPLVNCLAPSDMMQWDALAYHFAVPKLWLESGRVDYLPFIHHSNFPFVVDSLFMVALPIGEPAAKAVTFAYLLFGLLAVAGVARRWFMRDSKGRTTKGIAGWAALAFVGIPVVLWESGSGYVDVAHGLFAGLGILYAVEWIIRRTGIHEESAASHLNAESLGLPILLIGLACASKYTGLQVAVAVAIVTGIALLIAKQAKLAILVPAGVVLGSLAIASPWLVRNVVNTGNPVYPFLYERLGGRDWSQWRADIYRNEQQTFGVGRTTTGRDPSALGHAVLGLAYQPGRYINPGQTDGQGSPLGAIGAAAISVGLASVLLMKRDRRVTHTAAVLLILFVMWFFLSQQSRYIVTMLVPFCVFAAGFATSRPWGPLAKSLIAGQALFSGWLLFTLQSVDQLPVTLGQVSTDDYTQKRVGFARSAAFLNTEPSIRKIALYDEVFGYLLDKSYIWANPGHSARIPYETMKSGADLVDGLGAQGVSHVYLNLAFAPPEAQPALDRALKGEVPFAPETRPAMMANLDLKWRVLLYEAIAERRVVPTQGFARAIVFAIQ